MEGKSVDLATLMLEYMEKAVLSRKKTSLPYGNVLNRIFEYFMISIEDKPYIEPTLPTIGAETMKF